MFKLIFTSDAQEDFKKLNVNSKKHVHKAVCKTLGLMETNLKHNSLRTHEFSSLKGPEGEKVFELQTTIENDPFGGRLK
jgi:hypothetical protein